MEGSAALMETLLTRLGPEIGPIQGGEDLMFTMNTMKHYEHYEIFRSLRNKTKEMIRSAKRRLIMADLSPELSPRQLWSNLMRHAPLILMTLIVTLPFQMVVILPLLIA